MRGNEGERSGSIAINKDVVFSVDGVSYDSVGIVCDSRGKHFRNKLRWSARLIEVMGSRVARYDLYQRFVDNPSHKDGD